MFIDLCGAIVAVGELQQIGDLGPGEIYSYQTTRMEFYLVNIGFELLTYTMILISK